MDNDDVSLVKNIAQTLGVTLQPTIECKRVGKVSEDGFQLLVVDVKSEASKWNLIGKSKQLRSTENYSPVFLNPDLTKDEREAQWKL